MTPNEALNQISEYKCKLALDSLAFLEKTGKQSEYKQGYFDAVYEITIKLHNILKSVD